MTTHTHSTAKSSALPFTNGVNLQICKCGARKRSDNAPLAKNLTNPITDNGWYLPIIEDKRAVAIELVLNEGYIERAPTIDKHDAFDDTGAN